MNKTKIMILLLLVSNMTLADEVNKTTVDIDFCDYPEPTLVTKFDSIEDLKGKLVGSWRLCKPEPYPPLGKSGQFGIEFRSDGNWSILGTQEDKVNRLTGFEYEGTFEVRDMSQSGLYDIEISLDTHYGRIFDSPRFSESGMSMLLEGTRYVSSPSSEITDPEPNKKIALGQAGCWAMESSIHTVFDSEQDYKNRLIGVWFDCNKGDGYEQRFLPYWAAGIEFTEDGHWYYMGYSGHEIVRLEGASNTGTYEIQLTSWNLKGTNQLYMKSNGPGVSVSFSDAPQKMYIGSFVDERLSKMP